MKHTVTINKEEYKVKSTIRAAFIFNEATGKLNPETLQESYMYMWCILVANNRDKTLEWDDFIDAVDEDPNIMAELSNILDKEKKIEDLISPKDEAPEKEGKKKR